MRHPIVLLLYACCLTVSGIAQSSGWLPQGSGTSQWLHSVDFIDKNTGWTVGDFGIILKSTTGGASWRPQMSGTENPLQGVDFIYASTGIAVGGCIGCGLGIILKTTDGGSDWNVTYSGGDLFAVKLTSSTIGWAVGDNGLILKTTDAGDTWGQLDTGLVSTLASVSFINDSTGWIAGYFPGTILRTTDGGTSWESETNGINPGDDINTVFFLNHTTGWLAGSAFVDTTTTGIIRTTTDGGSTWLDQSSGTDQSLLSITFVDPSHGWTCGSSGVILKTTNGGTSWAPETSGTDIQLDCIRVRAGEGAWSVGLNGNIFRNNFGTLQTGRTVSFNAGWNMVSSPFTVPDTRRGAVFPTSISAAFFYNPLAGYQISDSIGNGKGYWLKLSQSQDIVLAGYPVDSMTLNLLPGWNLIGGIDADMPVSHIVQDPPGSLTSVFGY